MGAGGDNRSGIRSFPEFLEAFGVEESEVYTEEDRQEEIAEAYQVQEDVLAAFGRSQATFTSTSGPTPLLTSRPPSAPSASEERV